MNRETIFQQISDERNYQDDTCGNEFDDKNTANDWATYICRYAAEAASFNLNRESFEEAMIKVAALAVAALETSARNDGPAPRHYDDQPEPDRECGVTFNQLPEVEGLIRCDISKEARRCYDYHGISVYVIDNPVGLYYRNGGSTHRVVDANGIVHCVPFNGDGTCAIRWTARDISQPVQF